MLQINLISRKMKVFIISIVAILFAGAHCSKIPSKPMSPEDKESLIEELEHSQMLKELEVLIKNLDDEQLDKLETILADNADDATEFDEIMEELIEMGMDKGDIEDLKQLAALMEEFLIQIPGINKKLEMKSNDDLSDNIQVGQRSWSLALWYLEIMCSCLSVVSSWAPQQARTTWIHRPPPCPRWCG